MSESNRKSRQKELDELEQHYKSVFVSIKNNEKFKELERQFSVNGNSNSTFDVNDTNIYGLINTKNFLRSNSSFLNRSKLKSQGS